MREILAALLTVLCLAGCSSRAVSNTPRTAVEQMLLTVAVDKALEKVQIPQIKGQTVYLDLSNVTGDGANYIKVATRARFAQMGAVLSDSAIAADFTAEIASGCYGTEYKSFIVGIPPFPVPGSPVPFPSASVYKKVEQTGIAKLIIFVHKDGSLVSLDHFYAKADRDETFSLWHRSQQNDQIRESWENADAKISGK
jgi:hypothetical protein